MGVGRGCPPSTGGVSEGMGGTSPPGAWVTKSPDRLPEFVGDMSDDSEL
jgi:hypothetical protein